MNTRCLVVTLTIITWLGIVQRDAEAHRLDEYLQAAKLSIERSRVVLNLDLTPGISVAPFVFSLIDTNADGRISSAEAELYQRMVFDSIALSVDGTPLSLTPVAAGYPEYREMNAGIGIIHLVGAATFATSGPGSHQLFFRNTHQPKIGAYLANALLPADNQIEINGQWRDSAQHELTIDYRVTPHATPSGWWLIAGIAAAVAASLTMRYIFAQSIIMRLRPQTASRPQDNSFLRSGGRTG